MQKTSLKIAAAVGVLGIFGGFIRWLQIMIAFDSETGLVAKNSATSYVLIVFTILFAAAVAIVLRRYKSMEMPTEYNGAISQDKKLYVYITYAAAVLMALGGILTVLLAVSMAQSGSKSDSIFNLMAGIGAIAVAVAMVIYIRQAGKAASNGKLPTGRGASVLITVYTCLLLVATYKYIATDPVTWHYAPRILSTAAMALAMYYLTGFSYGKAAPMLSVFFGFLAVFFGLMTTVDSYPLGYGMINLALVLFLLLTSHLTLSNFGKEPQTEDSEL